MNQEIKNPQVGKLTYALYMMAQKRTFGFIVRNTEGNKKRDLYYNSVDQVERITGIDFFPVLPDDIEDEVEADANIKDWQ